MNEAVLMLEGRRIARGASLATLLVWLGTLALPGTPFAVQAGSGLWSAHLALELFTSVVSVLIVLMAWQAFAENDKRRGSVLIYALTVVAGVDLIRVFGTDNAPSLAGSGVSDSDQFLWFAGCCIELVGIALLALRVRLPGHRWHWQVYGLLTIAIVWVISHQLLEPAPWQTGASAVVTQSMAFTVWLLAVSKILLAVYFWRVAQHPGGEPRDYYFAAACLVLGLAELMPLRYVGPGYIHAITGHFFEAVAYALVYVGSLRIGLREPLELLRRSRQTLLQKQTELDAVLLQVPVGLVRLDRDGRCLYLNRQLARRLGRDVDELLGRPLLELLSPQDQSQLSYHWALAIAGQSSGCELPIQAEDGHQSVCSVWMAPDRNLVGEIVGAVAVVTDHTNEARLKTQLTETLREVTDLRTALDAHAIVAVTDRRGVITDVNDRFCQISKYNREELIGQTHRMINSGHHPSGFFRELWRTIADGKVWSGEICNRAKDGSLYWVHTTIVPYVDEKGRPQRYVAIRADITERKLAELKIAQMAYEDALTGMPNRRLLMDRLQQQMAISARSGQIGALLFMDLDHFKDINDTLGHERGDDLLKQVAQRLRSSFRESDTVARLGGDEFVVLVPELGADLVDATAQAQRLGQQLIRTLGEPYVLAQTTVTSSASFGVVMYRGTEISSEEILKQADIALYQAKAAGRRTLCFFDPATQTAFDKRMALEAALRQALDDEQFEVHYQPVVNAARDIVAVEALLRWRHPELGMVAPGEFISVAEKTGLIVPIGMWVVEQACKLLASWQADPQRCTWRIAVNVSARQFRDHDFVPDVLAHLERYGVGQGLLKLEVTESSLQENLSDTVSKMKQLGARGVLFAIDDFGTGYSSLAYLKAMPIHVLKIDRSFVRDLDTDQNDIAIAKTIIALAKHMDLEVVAEGVETEVQFATLQAHGCEMFQGYLLGRPMPAAMLGLPIDRRSGPEAELETSLVSRH